jgi:hypothetical protein
MDKPKFDKPYRFVKIAGDFVYFTSFTWSGDDTGSFAVEGPADLVAGFLSYTYNGSLGWREAIDKLHELGYRELRSLKTNGVVPPGWYPPETAAGCGRVELADLDE